MTTMTSSIISGDSLDEKQDEALVIAGPKYRNVRNPTGCVISFVYSKASLVYLCLIGIITTLSTYFFTIQINDSHVLCMFNDYLPVDDELRQLSRPVGYYCRFLEFSVPTNVIQLVFCMSALFFALNRRSRLFVACYIVLFISLLVGCALMVTLYAMDLENYLRPAVSSVLGRVVEKDEKFCQVLEPMLECRYNSPNTTDVIERLCEKPRRQFLHKPDCVYHLTSFLDQKYWLIAVIIQYGFLILIGVGILIRSSILQCRRERRRVSKLSTAHYVHVNGFRSPE
ncbi:unnamed protein product [Bursaphelenchus xylophilus]|uniref:(pine wood nematode) hypothetical protein n=1 Tax=Bursaphelenchus xylophilus TaxID=6326 RepID=A0A1I7RVJ8_BURXY|nr:unnamed protein product [Bursaphelenchus xylophilus]CAG9081781.1 unnamed protein product [Bursaphelenchus xylophilus]